MTGKTKTTKRSNPAKRGSFTGLIREIERDEARSGEQTVSSAAFRAAAMIRTMRQAKKLSQKELAARLGVKQSRISELEAGMGSQGPTWDLIERVADACEFKFWISANDGNVAFDAADTSIHRALMASKR
jgi:ribosome-binding protein aMBF1 (putative translation factor)